MMKKNLFLLTLCLIIITGGLAFADTCPNIVGSWDFTGRCIEYDPVTKNYTYINVEGTLYITDQNTCLFYGSVDQEPLVGAISNFIEVTMNNNGNNVINGILRGYDPRKKLFTRMDITKTHVQTYGEVFDTCRGTAKRR